MQTVNQKIGIVKWKLSILEKSVADRSNATDGKIRPTALSERVIDNLTRELEALGNEKERKDASK